MSGYLLDTNVISMLSPSRAEASAQFVEWLEAADEEAGLFLSVVTIHELEKGIGLLQSKGADAKAAGIRLWLSGLVTAYDDRILPIDTDIATLSGQLESRAIAAGHNPGMADTLIAGTARARELVVVTRNLKHFEPFDIPLLSPDSVKAT